MKNNKNPIKSKHKHIVYNIGTSTKDVLGNLKIR